jgi:hypothetical protein
MDTFLKHNRIFEFVLVVGLAIVFLAILMVFSGSNVTADVIVDQGGGGDFLTIQEGIDNAIPGENVYVRDGTYYENITIDKSIQLIGNGPATTIINASGLGNNAVNITIDGFEIQGFNITNNETFYGIYTTTGGFDIHHNEFFTIQYSIFVDISYLNQGSTTVDSMFITDNTVAGGMGFYFNRILFDTPTPGSDILVGQTVIDGNDLDYSGSWGIVLWGYEVINMNGGTVTWRDILITNNILDSSTHGGIVLSGNMENLTDVSVMMGGYDISGNNITCGGTGIQVDWWTLQELYGTTSVIAAQTMANDNIITAPTDGIQINFVNVGYDMYDDASVTVGDFIIDPNIIDSGNYGVYLYLFNSAYEMHNDSSFMMGDITIDDNDILDGGIRFHVDQCAFNMYDSTQANLGNVMVTNNNVSSSSEQGIYLYLYQLGSYLYDSSQVVLKEVHVEDNDVNKTGGVGYALYIVSDTIGTQMYGDSFLTWDDWYIEGNTVTSTQHGIQTGHETNGYEMYDNSFVVYHDIYVRDNVVDADNIGMWITNMLCGNYMEDSSTLIGGNMSITGNTVSSINDHGIQISYNYLGYYMYDQSHAEFGWFDVSYNNFSSNSNYGGYVDIYYLGAYMYGSSQVYIGDITITDNEFWSTGSDGLYYYEFYENAYEMYDNSYVRIGDILVNDNYINAGGDGIYLDTWSENAYYLHQHANADLGNIEVNRNIIEAGGDGIYFNQVGYWGHYLYFDNQVTMGHWQTNNNLINASSGVGIHHVTMYDIGSYLYGTSTFTMENIEVLGNTVNAYADDGIRIYFEYWAYYLYGDSRCEYGNFLFNDNTINSTDEGMEFSYIEYFAYYMYDNSYAEFGNFEINNNDIIAGYGSALGYDGIYMNFYENGYEMYGNSEAYFGHLQINDNTITCEDDKGIYFYYFYEIGAYLYDNSHFKIGNVEICRNWIDSNGEGIYIEYIYDLGYYNYDNSQAHFGDFLFNENNITSGSDGIYAYYLEYWGYDLYDSADAYFGDVEFNNNMINSSGFGIDIEYFYYWGYDLYGDNEVIIGHVQVNDNNVLATGGDGIYVYYFYDIGVYMYQTSYFFMENFEICRNIVNASGDGIEMYEIDELAYYMYDNSNAIFGDFLFNDNNIISGAYGFYNEYIEYLAYDMYDQSHSEFGNFEFNNNTIDAVDYGMHWYYGFYDIAYEMEDGSSCIMGHYQINDNKINVSAGDGIYFYEWYDVGIYMLEDAYFEMDNLEVCRNEINATGYGIYWYYFYDVAYYMGYRGGIEYPGFTTFIMGDILFNDNVIIAGFEGIYLYYFEYLAYEMYGNAYAEFGNFEVCRNHITITGSDEGIYMYDFYEWAYYMYDNSQAVFGSILVNDNNITSGDDGIYFYEWYDVGSYMYDQSTASFGNLEMCRNVINSTDDGINVGDIEDLAYYNYGSSVCYYGDFLFNDNIIIAGYGTTAGYGIYFSYIEYIAEYLYDQSDAYYGNFEFNRNVISAFEGGISVSNEYWGYGLYGSNEVIFGHVQFNDNDITVVDGDGMYVYHYDIGEYMEQSSYFWMDNFEICRNQITAGNETLLSNHGIDIDIEYLAYDNEDSAWCHFGDFLFNDNVIEAWGYGFYVEYLEYLGAYLCDTNQVGYCYAEFGNFEFNRNQITSYDDGFYVSDWEYWGYELYGDSEVHFGYIQINDNTITAGNATQSSEGMYFSDGPAYDFASYMYDNSYATFGNIEICRNIINATDHGMELYYYEYIGYEMYDNSRVEFQDFLVSENEVTAGGYGVYIYYFSYVGAYMYDESTFTMGDFYVNDNIVLAGLTTTLTGIELDTFEYNGYEMYNNAYAEFGSFEVCRNWVNATADGIYIYTYDWGAYMYDNSYCRMEDWYVNDNKVVYAGDNGIYLEFEYMVSYLYDFSQSYLGSLEVMRNDLNSTGAACLEVWWANNGLSTMYDYAYGVIGDCFIQDNTIMSWDPIDAGLYTGWDYPTDGVNDEAKAYLGDYYITHNTVYSAGNRGIDIYHEGLGIHLDIFSFATSRSVVEVGETWVTDNTITAPQGEGLFFLIGYAGYDVNDFSTVTVGGFYIERNIITSMDNAITVDMDDNGASVYEDAMVIVGPVVVNDNDVNSTDGTGIFLDANSIATDVFNNANAWLGDFMVTNNDIISSDIGILYELRSSVDVYDNAFLRVPGFIVTGNVVDSGISALNYTTIFTPGAVDATAILELGDVIISGNDFDGGIFGMAFDWQDPVPSIPQPVFRISHNDVLDGTSNSIGLYMKNIGSAFIETLTIDNYDQGVHVNNSNIWLMFNSTITNTNSYDLSLFSDSYIGAVNCTFDQADIFFEDPDSQLDVGWFMNVLVITTAGYGVPEANVTVEDVYSTSAYDNVANPFGQAFYIVCWEYSENITGVIDTYNDYTADADKSGVFGSASPNPIMDQSKLVIIVLGDGIPPTIIGDLSDSAGTTGDPFNFGVDAEDNFGIYQAYVNYRFGTTGGFTTVPMTGFGPHWKSVVLPLDYIGPMQYYFEVQDVGGFWDQSATTTVQITDNDAPEIVSDNSNATATTGDAFTFDLDAIDNIAVSEAHVVYWFGTGTSKNGTMTGTGPYNFTITVPSGSLDTLHYYFTIADADGNWRVGAQVDISVTDNDAPTINADNSDTFADLGQTFNFNADITDNIGMNEPNLVYWFGTEAPQNVTMTGLGPYTYQITIPPDLIYQLHYYFVAVDDYGNWLVGTQVDVNITDNIPPSDINDTSDTMATTGDAFIFRVNATDNIGVAECSVTYWFGTGTQITTSMTQDGPFTLSITIPSGTTDTLHYYFSISDFDGNSIEGPQVDISVQDNDAPSIVSDDSDDEATTGDIFTFTAEFADNIGVTNAYIFYWFGDDPETTATMSGDPFTREIVIPFGSDETLHYYLKAVDSAGNEYVGEQVDITISDNDAPILIFDGSDSEAVTGGNFRFNLSFEDNIGIVEVEVFYKFGEGTESSAIMTGTDVSTHTISIPGDSTGPLYYYVVARDAHGNAYQTVQRPVLITDNTPGTISNDQSDSSGKEGERFRFQIDASDNVGISEVMVAYWFGDDESDKVFLPLSETDGTYSGSFTPSGGGTMHYYFVGVDEAGNTFEGDENTAKISAKPSEAEGSIIPWILVILLVIVILVLVLMMMRKKKDEDMIPKEEERILDDEEEIGGLGIGDEEPGLEGEGPEETEDIDVDSLEEPTLEEDIETEVEPAGEEEVEDIPELEDLDEEPAVEESEIEETPTDEEPLDDEEKTID